MICRIPGLLIIHLLIFAKIIDDLTKVMRCALIKIRIFCIVKVNICPSDGIESAQNDLLVLAKIPCPGYYIPGVFSFN